MKYVAAPVGFVAARVGLYQFLTFPTHPPPSHEVKLTPESGITVVSADSLDPSRTIVGDQIVIAEQLVSENAVYIVANHLLFGKSAGLRAPEIIVFATQITGERLDVSGSHAASPGGHGAGGGSIFVASACTRGMRLDLSGGGMEPRDSPEATEQRGGTVSVVRAYWTIG